MAGGYVIKLKGAEMTLNTTFSVIPSNIPANSSSNSGATLVRIVNNGAATSTITQASGGSNVASCSVLANTEVYIQKLPTDTIAASANVQAVAVSFRD